MSDTVLDKPVRSNGSALLQKIPGAALVLVLMIGLFPFISPGFASPSNIINILMQSIILLLIALPMTFVIMTEGIDLSIGALLTLLTIVYASIVMDTGSFVLALLGTTVSGLAFGCLNGSLIAFLGIPPFVVTLGTMGIAQGLSLIATDGESIVGLPADVQFAYLGTFLGLPVPILIAGVAYALLYLLFYHARFGIATTALGGNRDALRNAGINDRRALISVYVLISFMAAVAAPLLCARMNAAHPTAAMGMEFEAIAAVALGGTQFHRGNGRLFGTLLGVAAIGVLRNGLNLLAVPSSVQVASVGLLVISALLLDGVRGKHQ